MRIVVLTFVIAAHVVFAASASAQDSVYVSKFVYSSDGILNESTPPVTALTAYLNGNVSRILTEQAPRYEQGDDNISGQGRAGVEFANFPELTPGDSVTLRFTDTERGEQGSYSIVIDQIPWTDTDPFGRIDLEPVDLPARPQNLELVVEDDTLRTLSWDAEPDLKYSIYRRGLSDVIYDNRSRYLYELVAEGVTGDQYTDVPEAADEQYAYVVYAQNDEGMYSAHSAEVVERLTLTGLTAESATATNATLSWDAFSVPVGETAGYTLYRRTEDGTFGPPLAFTGSETTYTDTRLEPGATYFYKVRARNEHHSEYGESESVEVTTSTDESSYHKYANLKVAVPIYVDTEDPYKIPEQEVIDIQKLLEYSKLFIWRQSGFRLNLEYTFYIIEEHKEIGTGSGQTANRTARHLAEDFGVVNTQYDYILRITPQPTGYWSIGAPVLDLPDLTGGDKRRTGFCQVHWPKKSGAGYPFVFDDIPTPPALVWTAAHEMQHNIDAVYRWNGHEEMAHGDFPQDFDALPVGRHYDFQAGIYKTFDYYLNLNSQWGDIYEAPDSDGDGFPDVDERTNLDELRFGSSVETADTDGDGLSDKAEAIDGLYHYSMADPNDADTDGDGVADGDDDHPRYPIQSIIPRYTPVIDGRVDEDWPVTLDTVYYVSSGEGYAPKLHMSYDDDSLYVGLDLPDIGVPRLFFDFDADGRLWGAGNTEMIVDLSNGGFSTFRSLDGTEEVRTYQEEVNGQNSGRPMWDGSAEYQDQFGRRVMYPNNVNIQVSPDFPRVDIEMAIPRNSFAGLTLAPGDSMRFFIDYDKVNNVPGAWANTFDEYSFAKVVLAGGDGTSSDTPLEQPSDVALAQNYPNPFNPETVISYTVDRQVHVELSIFDALGRHVRTLVDRVVAPGRHDVTFDATGLSSGTYFYRLQAADGRRRVRSLHVLK